MDLTNDKMSIRLFAEMLREIARVWHPAPAEQLPAEALKKLKELYDSGVISAEEYQEKRKKYLAQF